MSIDPLQVMARPKPSESAEVPQVSDAGAAPRAGRWMLLAVAATAQLMVVIDVTIVNIALPSAQDELGFSDSSRQWVITASALTFGSLLLLGGRLADLWGAKRVFLVGVAGFGVMSALGGAAGNFGTLVAARAGQGLFGALLAPTALAMVTTAFTDPRGRARAFGVWGAVIAACGGVGLVLGGALTEVASWRWTLFVNLAFAVVAGVGAWAFAPDTRPPVRPVLDLAGAGLVSVSLFALVLGFANAGTDGWRAVVTWGPLVGAGIGLLLFVARQARAAHPLLPLRVLSDRDRGASFVAIAVANTGLFAVFFFLTLYLQRTLGYSPLQTGVAFLPMVVTTVVSSYLATNVLLVRAGAKVTVPTGLLLASAATVWLTTLELDSGYPGDVLPRLLALGLSFGLIIAPAVNLATAGVDPRDAGVGSAVVNTVQRIGGAVGIAFLSTVASDATNSARIGEDTADPLAQAQAVLHGYEAAYWWAGGIYAVGAAVAVLLYRVDRTKAADPVA